MGKITIQKYTTKEPIHMIGYEAGVCWGANVDDEERNYDRGIDCLSSGHGRTFEFPDVYMTIDGYSAKVLREFYTHLSGDPTRLQQSTRYVDLKDGERIKSVHSGAYGRMRWDEPSKTIITRFDTPSSGVYVHPARTRTITAREAARIQSFDDNFVFYGNKTSINKQIGNAVPPLLAYYLAKVIKKASEYYDNETISK